MFVLGATAQLVLVTVLMSPLTYVAAAANFPLQDASLWAMDKALGFDGRGYIEFVNAHPVLAAWLTYGYSMIRWPIFAIPVLLAAAYRYQRLAEFTLAFALALIVTTLVSALVPAVGIYHQIGLDPATLTNLHPRAYVDSLRELGPVRTGALRQLDLFHLTGLVTFPSFHAASAALYTWALWPLRWFRPVAVIANVLMLASTPVDGAHYLVDVIAGLAVAAFGIVLARALTRRLASPQPSSEVTLAVT
jgi:membrane-associated phospholipid phosphatase